jgi:hypothetical protein
MRCDQCQILSINGLACHEIGCPNTWKTWIEDRQEWVFVLRCFYCGFPVEEGTICSCRDKETV